MPKRFTDTDLWKTQRWFKKLPPLHKLSFCYIKDVCDHAGIWKIDCSELCDDLGLTDFDLDDFILHINTDYNQISGKKETKERIIVIDGKYIWITRFIQFQYENKESKINISPAVKTALLKLLGINILHTSLNKGYVSLMGELHEKYISVNDNLVSLIKELHEGFKTPKDKDKDKDKDKGIKEGGKGETIKGISFDEKFEYAIMSDGSKQKLGQEQSILAVDGSISPIEIIKGYSY